MMMMTFFHVGAKQPQRLATAPAGLEGMRMLELDEAQLVFRIL
jgi:hypothetical protein